MDKHNGQPDWLLRRSTAYLTSETRSPVTTSSNFVLQWGNHKRMRCMKVQVRYKDKHNNNSNGLNCPAPVQRTTVRVDRRVVKDSNQQATNSGSNGYLNLRQRPESPSHRIIRNSENSIAIRGHSNVMKGLSSPERVGAHDKRVSNNHAHTYNNGNTNHHNGGRGGSASSETAHDSKKGGGSSTGSDAMQALWPPKFVIALTNKEKEEDFLAIKGSKLPQRPKKRAKFIQRTVNLISPGAWLCDLTLERYEVREQKVSKKRLRGLKAMGNMASDSE